MSTEILKDFLIAVGFKVDSTSTSNAMRTVKDYERAIVNAEKAIDQARLDGAKTAEQRAKVESELHLKSLKQGLAEARAVEENQKRRTAAITAGLTSIAAAATAAATVVAAAMVKLTGGFDNLYFVSQRTGASANNLKSLGYAFSQVGSTAESALQAVESFAKARRTNPGINAMLRGYGVDTRGDTSDVLMNGIDAIQKRHPYFAGAQIADMLGVSEDQFQTLTKYKDQIKAYREEYTKTQRVLNVNSDETTRASASIQRSLGSLTAVVGVLMEKLYTTLAPVLERIVKGFRDWIEAHPEQVEKIMRGVANAVEVVGTALGKVGDWLGDEDNQKKMAAYWDKFVLRITEAVKQIKELLELLIKMGKYLGLGASTADDPLGVGHAVSGLTGSGDGTGAEKPGLFRRGLNAVKRGLGIGGAEDTSGGKMRAGGNAKGARESYDFWVSKGFTPAQAAGLVGMEQGESPSFNPRDVGDGGAAHGSFQWHPDRRRNIMRGTGINIDTATHQQQLEAAWWELNNTEPRALKEIRKAKTPGEAAAAGVYFFERPGDKAGQAVLRGQYANRWHKQFSADPAKAAPAAPIVRPRASPLNMTPGGFDVNALTSSMPMGASSISTDNSRRSDVKFGDTHVTISGNGDPHATAASFKRAQSDLDAMRMRDVQTAVR